MVPSQSGPERASSASEEDANERSSRDAASVGLGPVPDRSRRGRHMRRRDFLALIGGGVLHSPVAAFAQKGEQVRHLGVLFGLAEDDPLAKSRVNVFEQGLEGLGWVNGRNIEISYRWAPEQPQISAYAK